MKSVHAMLHDGDFNDAEIDALLVHCSQAELDELFAREEEHKSVHAKLYGGDFNDAELDDLLAREEEHKAVMMCYIEIETHVMFSSWTEWRTIWNEERPSKNQRL